MLALLLGVLMLATACGPSEGSDDGKDSSKPGGDNKASTAVVSIAPKDGADNVATSGALKISVKEGKLTSVTVKDTKDKKIEGKIIQGGTHWQPSEHLNTSTQYTVDVVAEDSDGREAAEHASFSTVVPEDTFVGYFTPEDGSEVGVGMPVSINFNRAIANQDVVEKAIKVTAEPGVEIEGHWFGDQRIDFRPQEYWKPGTKVTLSLRLRGVEGVAGIYGTQRKDVTFTIGRSQVSTVDAESKTMVVQRDGKNLRTIQITAGAPGNPTWNGKMVISEKHEVTRMDGATVGFGGEYDIADVPHAMRLTTSGTFIHGNYWLPESSFGSINDSHGCVGLFDARGGGDNGTPGAWFYNNSLIGDVVQVKNAKDQTVAPDNGLNGWNMDWEEWSADQ